MAKRVRTPDLHDDIITSVQILDNTITIDNIKTETDLDAVTAETIPYERTNPSVSIHDVIAPLTVNTFNLIADDFTATGLSTDFSLSATLDTTVMHQVFMGGQLMTYNYDYTLETSDTVIRFVFIPETGLIIKVVYQAV